MLSTAALLQPVIARADAEHAEDGKWLILPAVTARSGDPAHPTRAAARLVAQDLRANGVRTFTAEEAKTLFEQRGSAPPMTASAADIDQLARDAQRALYHVASGLPARAKDDVERALGRARGALESLNRETRAAQHLLDTCLYLVRAYLQRDQRGEARRQALECRRLVPDIKPEPTMHPPDVIGVLAEAQAQLRASEPVSLRIESEPMGCAAYVNGRNLGATPRELSQLSPGEYRVQAECNAGVMGRVHRVALANSRVVLKIDTRYDRTVESLFDLSLHYPSVRDERRHAAQDAVETARAVGAGAVVVARLDGPAEDGEWVRLERYRVSDGELLATARLPVAEGGEAPAERVAAARETLQRLTPPAPPAAALAEASSVPAAAPAAASASAPIVPASSLVASEPADERDDDDLLPTVGYVLGGAGVVAQAAGWLLYTSQLSAHDDYVDALNANATPDSPTVAELSALRDLDTASRPPPILIGAGALASAASVPLWLPREDGMPYWGYLGAGAGAALAIAGGVLTLKAGSCEVDRHDRCTQPALATDLGPLLLMQAVPLLALPVVQAIRQLDSGTRVSLHVGHGRALLRLKGRL